MKKIFLFAVILTLLAASASAQQRPSDRIQHQRIERGSHNGQLTRPEKFRIHKDRARYKTERRRSMRDGRVTHHERRRLHKMRKHNRHETFRLKHNGRRRAI